VRKYVIDNLHDARKDDSNNLINMVTELQAEVHESENKIIDFKKHLIFKQFSEYVTGIFD
jgi:hypothetical protein